MESILEQKRKRRYTRSCRGCYHIWLCVVSAVSSNTSRMQYYHYHLRHYIYACAPCGCCCWWWWWRWFFNEERLPFLNNSWTFAEAAAIPTYERTGLSFAYIGVIMRWKEETTKKKRQRKKCTAIENKCTSDFSLLLITRSNILCYISIGSSAVAEREAHVLHMK